MFGFGGNKKKQAYNFTRASPTVNWDVDKEIGQGSFATVYLAKRKSDKMIAALKSATLIDEKTQNEDMEDLLNEIRIMQLMDSENIIRFYEGYYEECRPPVIHLLVEYCEGKSLDTLIVDRVEVSEDQIKAVLYQTSCGLEYMHERFVIHRDIKSLNILISESGIIKLADFGVSAICTENKMFRSSFVGSLNWMSPEVLAIPGEPDRTYNEKCDIWSLGITAIEMAEICVPFSNLNAQVIMHRILEGEPPKLSCPSIWSKEFNDFVGKTLFKAPANRLSASDCIKHPFLNCEIAHSKAPVLELLFVQVSEEVDECLMESDDLDISILPAPHDMFEISESDEPTISIIAPDISTLPSPKYMSASSGTKTVKKTVRYKMNGQIKEKTVMEVLDEDKKTPDRKCVKDIVLEQKEFNRNIKLDHKLKKTLELQITTMCEEADKRHDSEKMHILDKTRRELDQFQKAANKDLDRYQSTDDTLQQKRYKKVRTDFDSQKKAIQEKYKEKTKEMKKAAKSLRKTKEEIATCEAQYKQEMENEFVDAHEALKAEWEEFLINQKHLYVEFCTTLAENRNKKIDDLECDQWQVDIKHALEMYSLKYKCEVMPLNLQLYLINSRHRKEDELLAQYNSKKLEEMNARQAREQKETPKILQNQCKHNLSEYKKQLSSDKSIPKPERKERLEIRCTEEKALIAKGISDMNSKHDAEKTSLHQRAMQYMEELAKDQRQERLDVYQHHATKLLSSFVSFENSAGQLLKALFRKKAEIASTQADYTQCMMLRELKVMQVPV